MSDPMEPAQKLMEAFGKEIESLGLQVHTFAILPNPDGPPHMVQAMLTFDGAEIEAVRAGAATEGDLSDGVELSPEELDVFESLARETTRDDAQAKADETAAALERLQKSLEEGTDKGILGD